MNIIIDEDKFKIEEMYAKLVEAAIVCVEGEGLDSKKVEISLSSVSKEEIKAFNLDYRNIESITDVLSFPQYNDPSEAIDEELICLGDVVICEEVVREQALEYGHSEIREYLYLFVHSVLHLLGYDHIEGFDKDRMRKREEEVLSSIGIDR